MKIKALKIILLILLIGSNLFGQSVDDLIELGRINCKNNYDSAQLVFQQAWNIKPYNESCIDAKLNCYFEHEYHEKAFEFINHLIQIDSTKPYYFFRRGAYINNINYLDSSCLIDYKRALELDPNYYDAIYNIAAYYINKIDKIEQQLKIEQGNKNKLNTEKEQNYKIGIKYLELAFQLKPEDEIVQSILLEVYTDLNLDKKREELELEIEKYNNR